jgi:hypothetical protein
MDHRPRALALVALLVLPQAALAGEASLLGHPPLELGSREPTVLLLHLPGLEPDSLPRVRAEEGYIDEVEAAGPELVRVEWEPPEDDTAGGTETFSVRYRTTDGERQDQELKLPYGASPARSLQLSTSTPVVSPDQDRLELTVQAGAWSQDNTARTIQLTPSLGRIEDPTLSTDGTATATWVRPAGLDVATTLLVLATDAGAPDRVLSTLVVPVQVKRANTFEVPPDSKVIVTVGETSSTPAQASPAGTVGLEMVLDPRVDTATLTATTPHGVTSTQPVELPPSAGPQAVLSPLPDSVARDPTAPVPLVLATVGGDGSTLVTPPKITVSTGKMVGPPLPRGGAWLAPWQPPADGDTALITVEAAGKKLQQRVSLHTPAPRVSLSAEPAVLPVGGRDLEVTATTTHPSGAAWAGSGPAIGLSGGSRRGSPQAAEDGRWVLKARKDTDSQGVFAFVEPPVASGAPPEARPAELVAWIDAPPEQPLGMHLLRYAVVDAQGAGISAVPVTATVVGGSAELGEVKPTWDNGMSWTPLTPSTPAPVTVQLEAAGLRRTVSVLPGEAPLVATGSRRQQALLERWQAAAPALWVDQDQPVVAAVAAAPTEDNTTAAPTSQDDAPPERDAAKRTKPQADRGPWAPASLRVSGRYHIQNTAYASKQAGSSAGPEEAAFTAGGRGQTPVLGGAGFGLGALWTIGDSPWQLELDVRRVTTAFQADFSFPTWEAPEGTDFENPDSLYDGTARTWTAPTAHLAGRYRFALGAGGLHAFVSGGLGHQEAAVFTWKDREPHLTEVALWGARVGGGLSYEHKRLFVEAGVAELLAPWPISTQLGLDLDVGLAPAVALRLGTDLGLRRMTYAADDSQIDVGDQSFGANLGLVYTLR